MEFVEKKEREQKGVKRELVRGWEGKGKAVGWTERDEE